MTRTDTSGAARSPQAHGLPVAVEVLARPWRDHVALAAMATIEAEARKQPDYPRRPPL